jgi:hypothetical protein
VGTSGRGGHKERVKEGKNGEFMCENRIMKPVEIVLRKGMRENDEGGESN